MSSPLSRYENTVATTDNLPSLGLPSLADAVVRMGATALIDGHRVRLGSPIERLVRTPRVAVSCAASTVRDRVRARAEEIRNSGEPQPSPAETTAALIVAMKERIARLSGTDAAPVTEPAATASADAQLAALIRNPPSAEDQLLAALRRDAQKGSAR